MTKENYLLLKQNLADLSVEIRNHKKYIKDSQRALSDFEYRVGHYDSLRGRQTDKDQWMNLCRPASRAQSDLLEMKSNYRAMHILYSLERGKTLDQIEQPKDEGYWKIITYRNKLKIYVKKYGFDKLDSLPNSTLQSLGWIEGNGQRRLFTRDEMPGPKRLKPRYMGKLYRIDEGVEL